MKIQNIHVFDGQNVLEGLYDVFIQNHRISKICVHDPASGGCEEEILDAAGRWLLPGLIDLHVHLTWNGKEDPAADITHSTREENMLETVSNALKYLKHGITSVRDLGSPDDAALHVGKAIEKGQIAGPRIFATGMSLIMTGGHDPFHGLSVDGPWEALKGVRTQVKKGAKVIKISATGGVYGRESGESVDDTELRQEEVDMIIDEAHRRKVPVTAPVWRQASTALNTVILYSLIWQGRWPNKILLLCRRFMFTGIWRRIRIFPHTLAKSLWKLFSSTRKLLIVPAGKEC